MGKRERAKGLRGEREVAAAYIGAGFVVRGLEGGGDHLVIGAPGLTIHSETKRHEVLRVPTWIRQAELEAPQGTVPAVHFRQNNGRWYVVLALDDFVAALPDPRAPRDIERDVREQLDRGEL